MVTILIVVLLPFRLLLQIWTLLLYRGSIHGLRDTLETFDKLFFKLYSILGAVQKNELKHLKNWNSYRLRF